MGHRGTCGGFDGVRSRASFRRFKTTQMSVINEMPPITPQAHFISGPDLGLISHQAGYHEQGRGEHSQQRRCHLWSGHGDRLQAGGHAPVPAENPCHQSLTRAGTRRPQNAAESGDRPCR